MLVKKNILILGALVLVLGLSLLFSFPNNKEEVKTQTQTTTDTITKDSIMHKDIDKKYLLGHFKPENDSNYILIPLPYANRKGLYAEKKTYESFLKMREAAEKDGIHLQIISACRNFDYQKGIWEAKWNGNRLVEGENLAKTTANPVERAKKILRYSSMPGTSRHHWGTDIDINSVSISYFKTGKGKKEFDWLVKNAADFGFYQVYIPKGEKRASGYEEEAWHWTYLPVSKDFIYAYKEKVSYDDIKGFSGAETAEEIQVIKYYVLGINPECL
jgi:zinc D-Ala-D-Ala carboxypeptidase